MTRQLDDEKQRVWAKRIERFQKSGLSIAKFCESERVSVQSYYYWLRRVGSPVAETDKARRSATRHQIGRSETPLDDAPTQHAKVQIRFRSGVEVFIPSDCLESLRCVLEHLERPNQSDSFRRVLLSTRSS